MRLANRHHGETGLRKADFFKMERTLRSIGRASDEYLKGCAWSRLLWYVLALVVKLADHTNAPEC